MKRFLSLALAAVMCVGALCLPTFATEDSICYGDANGDGLVDNTDASIILKYDAGISDLAPEYLAVTDLNADDMVDNTDAAIILKYDAGLDTGNDIVGTPVEPEDPNLNSVAIPNVVGKTEAEAVKAITDAGYTNVKTVSGYKANVAAGTVFAQSKTADKKHNTNGLIVLQVSNGLSAEDSAAQAITDPLLQGREQLDVGANADYTPLNYDNMKGMWLSQLDLIPVYYDYANNVQRTEDDFAARINTIMKNIAESGFNTVVVQVHPDCDSLYVSEYYPWSDYLNGNSNRDQNQALLSADPNARINRTYGNTSMYDLMPIMIDAAHKYNLSFQAWINPMRACAIDEMPYINDSYLIKQWYNDPEKSTTYLFKTTSRYYLNPAYEEVRNYIVAVAQELCRYYDIDGVHMDDYFYPSADANYDKAAFQAQTQFASLNDFRKNNVNTLVKAIYDAVKAENSAMLFGISPGGNIDTNMNTLSADVQTWCSVDGYIDYICPQIYFGFLHSSVPFDGLSQRWINMTTAENVKVILGLTMHKIGKLDQYAGAGGAEWKQNSDVLKKSFQWAADHKTDVDGVCLFSYQYMFDALTGERVDYTKAETDNFLPVLKGMSW